MYDDNEIESIKGIIPNILREINSEKIIIKNFFSK